MEISRIEGQTDTTDLTESETDDTFNTVKIKKSRKDRQHTHIPMQGMLVPKGTYQNVLANPANNLTETKEQRPINKYTETHRGEFNVLIDTSASKLFNNNSLKNGLFLWEKIRNFNLDKPKHIKAIGKSLYKITFETYEHANNSLTNAKLIDNNIRAFIPKNFTETYGVVRQVPTTFNDNEIMANIHSNVKVTSVQRILKRDTENKENLVPTLTMKIGFEGNELPELIQIFFVNFRINHYIPKARQCYNCGRLGHTKLSCKAQSRCIICGKENGCEKNEKSRCVLCGNENHVSLHRDKCTVWEKELKVVELKVKKLT